VRRYRNVRAHDHFKYSHWWKRQSQSKFTSHYTWGANGVCNCKMDVKVYMDSYMASNGSCFMVTWTIFKNHLLEVGLARKWKTMALRMLTTIDLFYFLMCEDLAWIEIHWNNIWLRTRSHMTSHYTRGFVTTLRDVGRCVGTVLGHTVFWALTIIMVTTLGSCVKRPLEPMFIKIEALIWISF
jgi:hypothetical protein